MAENNKNIKPGPGGNRRGMPRPKVENPVGLFKRIMGYVFKYYPVHMITIVVCILLTVFSSVQGTLFTRTLIDSYIQPMLDSGSSDYGPLLGAMARVAVFYGLGVLAAFVQQRVMVFINQGTLKRLSRRAKVLLFIFPTKTFSPFTLSTEQKPS